MADHSKLGQFVNNTIPIFTGEYGPNLATELDAFIGCCENAVECLNSEEQQLFLRIIITRFRGKAYNVLQGLTVTSIDELKKQLRLHFAPEKSFITKCSELKLARQIAGEPLGLFIARIRELLRQCKVAAQNRHPDVSQANAVIKDLEEMAVIAFQTGLVDPQLRMCLLQNEGTTLDAIIEKAQKIEELNTMPLLPQTYPFQNSPYPFLSNCYYSPVNTANQTTQVIPTPFMGNQGNSLPANTTNKRANSTEEEKLKLKCGFCSKRGHTYTECITRKNTPYCTSCKVYGHKVQTCKPKKQVHAINQHSKTNSQKSKCDFCLRWGHTIDTCRAKAKWESKNSSE